MLSDSELEQRDKTPSPPNFMFRSIGVLITVLGKEFKEELFERVLHEHLPYRKCAMASTELDDYGDVHYHMVAVCTRANLWHTDNLRLQLGKRPNIAKLRTPADVITAMAYISKHHTPRVWSATPSTARHYKLAVLERIIRKEMEAGSEAAKAHYKGQYERVRLDFFPPEQEELLQEAVAEVKIFQN